MTDIPSSSDDVAADHARHVFDGSRRTLLASTLATGLLASTPSFAASARMPGDAERRYLGAGKVVEEVLRFPDPAEHLRAFLKIEKSLDGEPYVWWYHWSVFGVRPDTAPVPLLRYEGIEVAVAQPLGGDRYNVQGHNLSFPRDFRNGEFISTWRNPITEREVPAGISRIEDDPGYIYSPEGVRPARATRFRPLEVLFRRDTNLVYAERTRSPPPGTPAILIESGAQCVDAAAFADRSRRFLPALTSGLFLAPYMPWMEMGGTPGHLACLINGRKLRSVEELPDEFLSRLRREYPHLLRIDPAKLA
jgi:hypothetical protein